MVLHKMLAASLLASTTLVLPTGAIAQAPAATAGRDARIDALEAQLRRLEAEITALKGRSEASAAPAAPAVASSSGAAASPSSQTPSTAASADVSGTAGKAGGTAVANARTSSGSPVPTSAAIAHIDGGHPNIASSDGRFTANLVGVMQFDAADYFQRDAGPIATDLRRGGAATDTARGRNLADGTTFRRARIGISGKAFGDFDYSILFDFGGSGVEDNGHIQELWLQYSGWKPAHIRVGAFAPFIGLEDAGSTNGMPFLERPASADIARSLAGGDFREGAQIAFTGTRWFASGAMTGRLVNTGGSSTVQPYQSQLGFIGRAGVLPIKTQATILHMGVHGSYVDHPADTGGPDVAAGTPRSAIQLRERPELRVDGTRLIDTGAIDAIHAFTAGAEAAFQHRNLLVQGEYEHFGIDRRNSPLSDPRFHGFYVEGSWMLTGEQRKYNEGNYAFDAPPVKRPFNPLAGNWGAWELALRWSDMNLNYHQGALGAALPAGGVRGGEQKIATAGVNWYFNSVARAMFDVQRVSIDRLSPNPTTYLTPLGADVGQHYTAAAARFQLAF